MRNLGIVFVVLVLAGCGSRSDMGGGGDEPMEEQVCVDPNADNKDDRFVYIDWCNTFGEVTHRSKAWVPGEMAEPAVEETSPNAGLTTCPCPSLTVYYSETDMCGWTGRPPLGDMWRCEGESGDECAEQLQCPVKCIWDNTVQPKWACIEGRCTVIPQWTGEPGPACENP